MEPPTARLYLLFTPALCAGDPWRTLELALDGGVDLVQWRVKADPRQGLDRCLAVCRARGVPLIVNDDPDLAVAVGAAGAHVGQDDRPAAAARAVLGPDRWLGVSTHDADQVRRARRAGADHLGFGPCFATATKGYPHGIADGPVLAAALAAAGPVPVYAIGGIDADRLPDLVARGVRRVAVSAAILGAADPRAAAAALRDRLG